jgi:hypothetical protein
MAAAAAIRADGLPANRALARLGLTALAWLPGAIVVNSPTASTVATAAKTTRRALPANSVIEASGPGLQWQTPQGRLDPAERREPRR